MIHLMVLSWSSLAKDIQKCERTTKTSWFRGFAGGRPKHLLSCSGGGGVPEMLVLATLAAFAKGSQAEEKRGDYEMLDKEVAQHLLVFFMKDASLMPPLLSVLGETISELWGCCRGRGGGVFTDKNCLCWVLKICRIHVLNSLLYLGECAVL